jgi:hypothetical protein
MVFMTRKQMWRRTRSPTDGSLKTRRCPEAEEVAAPARQQRQRPPLSLFVGDAAVERSERLTTSFSDRSLALTPSGDGVRRSVSEQCMTKTRSLFGSAANSVVTGKRAKAVSFESQVKVVLIPTARELPLELKLGLWWTRDDNVSFQRSIFRLLPPGTDLTRNVLSLGKCLDKAEGLLSACTTTSGVVEEEPTSTSTSLPEQLAAVECQIASGKDLATLPLVSASPALGVPAAVAVPAPAQ